MTATAPLALDVDAPLQTRFGELTTELIHYLAVEREEFDAGALTGRVGVLDRDRLVKARAWAEAQGRHAPIARYLAEYLDVRYTVVSFDMPIAWQVGRYWHVANEYLSPVTKRHQQSLTNGLVHLLDRKN